MRNLTALGSSAELAGAWCNGNATTSAIIEAISLVTPALERFFIRTVADCLPIEQDVPLEDLCRQFIREEAEHTSAHRRFNAALLEHLKSPPPGLAGIEKLLDIAHRHLSLSSRVALVAALEHFTAVLSKSYLRRQEGWHFNCPHARNLFAQHAREEIAHRAVAFDLWLHRGGGGVPARFAAIAAILLGGATYLGLAIPWIIYRKNDNRFATSFARAFREQTTRQSGSTLAELLRYLGRDYHPRHLIEDAVTSTSDPGRNIP